MNAGRRTDGRAARKVPLVLSHISSNALAPCLARAPVFTMGCVSRSLHSATIRLETSAALDIELDEFLGRQHVQRHLHHADRALDHGLARRHHGLSLLAPQHGAAGSVKQ
jgi:hypothetical protein